MNGTHIGGTIFFGTLLLTAWTEVHGDRGVLFILYLVSAGMFFLFITERNPLKHLWIGPSEESMKRDIAALEQVMAAWTYPDGSAVPMERRRKLMKRQRRVEAMLSSYRESRKPSSEQPNS